MADAGFGKFLWHNFETPLTAICAFAASSEEYHILAFRGTKLPQDWIVDLACTAVGFEEVFPHTPAIGEIHAGFGGCLARGLQKIRLMLRSRKMDKPLLITGHSLGGALAALAAVYFSVTKAPVPIVKRIYTFGQPRVGLQNFCSAYSRFVRGKLVRFVNNRDLVPRVPLRCQKYADGGAMIHFDSSGVASLDSPEWRKYLATPFETLKEVAGMILNVKGGVADHSMSGYRELVERNEAKLAALLPVVCKIDAQ
jgi:hypothetical protein